MSEGWILILGGVIAVCAYVLISNTIWLLIGSRVLQSMPGVSIPGVRGTLRIALMLVLSLVGVLSWVLKALVNFLTRRKENLRLADEVASSIRRGARVLSRSNERKSFPCE